MKYRKGFSIIEALVIIAIIAILAIILFPVFMIMFQDYKEFDAKVILKHERLVDGSTEYLVDVLPVGHSIPVTLLNSCQGVYSVSIQGQLQEDHMYHFKVRPGIDKFILDNIVSVERLE